MGDFIAMIACIAAFVWGWKTLAGQLKARGRHWLFRHLMGFAASYLAAAGVLFVALGIGLIGEEGSDVVGIVLGFVFAAPLAIALFKTRDSGSRPHAKARVWMEVAESRDDYLNPPDDALGFVYEDARGDVTKRYVVDWNDDGRYIEGYCLRARDVRTFRRDRIQQFIQGEHLLGTIARPEAPSTTAPIVSRVTDDGSPLEVLFTGFTSEARKSLEALAEDAGMVVRAGVTKRLDFLVGGPNAGPKKLEQARQQGCTLMSEEEFRRMLVSGELPSAMSVI